MVIALVTALLNLVIPHAYAQSFPAFYPDTTGPHYIDTISDGCAQWSSSILTSTGSACGSGSGGFSTTSVNYWHSLFRDWNVIGGNSYLAPTTTLGIIVNASSTFNQGLTVTGWDIGTTTAVVCKDARHCNYTTIQSAINAGWTDILVKDGTYAEQITFTKAKTKLRAESLATIIQCNGSTQSPCVSSAGFDESTIQGFTINETNANPVGTAIDFSGSAIFRILDNRTNNFATSTYLRDIVSETFYGSIERNTFFNPRTCIDLNGTQPNANSSSNNRCRPTQTAAGAGGFGLYLEDVRGFTSLSDDFEGTTTSNGVTGIYVGTTSREIHISNPWVEGNTTGVNIASGANRVTFNGGSITSNGTDIVDNGTNSVFINTSKTGVLQTLLGTATSTNFAITNITSAALLADGSGTLAEYAGTSCTNQFIRSLSALAAATCASVQDEDLNLADITLLDFTNDAGFITTRDWNVIGGNGWLAPTTSLGIIVNASSSINGNFTAQQATTTHLAATGLTASRALFSNSLGSIVSVGTVGAIEAAVGSQNILLETEIDGCSELAALLDAETGGCNGTTGPVFPDSATFSGLTTLANATSTLWSSTYASTTDLILGRDFSFGGVTGNSWDDFCTAITGGAGLCDGNDATGAGGTGSNWNVVGGTSFLQPSTTIGVIINASSSFNGQLNAQKIGIASSTLMTNSVLSVVGQTQFYGNYHHFGTAAPIVACPGLDCLELWGDDNTTGGVTMGVGNRNSGSSAFSGFFLNNDKITSAVLDFGFIGLNSSGYSDTTFGSYFAKPNMMFMQNSMGLLSLISSTSTVADSGISFVTGTTSTIGERARITPGGFFGIGTTTPRWPLQVTSTTSPQLVLTGATTSDHWSFRNAAGVLYIATSSRSTFATSTLSALYIDAGARVNIPVALNVGSNRIQDYHTLAFTYGTSSQGVGTTTRYLGPAAEASTFVSVQCDFSKHMNIRLYDGTNSANYVMASSTVGTYVYNTNNTFTVGEPIRVDIGTSTASLGQVDGSCRFKYRYTN